MYQKYQSDAIVIRSYEYGEADRVYGLFTQEFGFIWARCSAVRRERSKMRYALQMHARAKVSLVRGNAGWRLVGASAEAGMKAGKSGAAAFARIASLLDRLVHGEEKNEYLFATIAAAHQALTAADAPRAGAIELLCVARILYALGYISIEALGSALFAETAFSTPLLEEADGARRELLHSVNKALTEAQL